MRHILVRRIYLLHLELDGSLDFIGFGGHRFVVRQKGRELSSLVQTRTQETGNLFDERLGSEEGIIALG